MSYRDIFLFFAFITAVHKRTRCTDERKGNAFSGICLSLQEGVPIGADLFEVVHW